MLITTWGYLYRRRIVTGYLSKKIFPQKWILVCISAAGWHFTIYYDTLFYKQNNSPIDFVGSIRMDYLCVQSNDWLKTEWYRRTNKCILTSCTCSRLVVSIPNCEVVWSSWQPIFAFASNTGIIGGSMYGGTTSINANQIFGPRLGKRAWHVCICFQISNDIIHTKYCQVFYSYHNWIL